MRSSAFFVGRSYLPAAATPPRKESAALASDCGNNTSSVISTVSAVVSMVAVLSSVLVVVVVIIVIACTIFASAAVTAAAGGDSDVGKVDDGVSSSYAASPASAAVSETVRYGVDVSFPIHRRVSVNYPWLPHNNNNNNSNRNMNGDVTSSGKGGSDNDNDDKDNDVPLLYRNMPIQVLGDRRAVYNDHLEGCREAFRESGESRLCDIYEYDRIIMNNRQPQSMQNYTTVGFLKTRAPTKVIELATDFWTKNRHRRKPEVWPPGNTYTNHWSSPTYMVSIDDKSLRGSGGKLKERLWNAAQETLEDWTDEVLSPTSMYGIRIYTRGAILLPHVDRLPLVSSAMINVAQEGVDEPWPMELYDHNGVAHNVTLEPGDMLLFESHSVLHGRPFPFRGDEYAMLFIHFEPVGHTLRHVSDSGGGGARGGDGINLEGQYKKATEDGVGGQSASFSKGEGALPPYIKKESPEEEHWLLQHPDGWKMPTVDYGYKRRTEEERKAAHEAAAGGDVKAMDELLRKERQLPQPRNDVVREGGRKDENGDDVMKGRTTSMTEEEQRRDRRDAGRRAEEDEQEEEGGSRSSSSSIVNDRDYKGWQLLHKGAAHGHADVVKLLVEHGADVNARTGGGRGATPLHLAESKYGSVHPVVQYLKSLGALNIGPEL